MTAGWGAPSLAVRAAAVVLGAPLLLGCLSAVRHGFAAASGIFASIDPAVAATAMEGVCAWGVAAAVCGAMVHVCVALAAGGHP